ncbi:hypothetical protein [Pseudogemmobacter sonorensis]|uniref:hypothetical protein n=1 Tax=Pseudogemmobacter sonorensis TaxID=2989681 RepID=UPI003692D7F4
MDAIDRAQRQRGPTELPVAAGRWRLVQREGLPRDIEPELSKMMAGRQADLPIADHHDLGLSDHPHVLSVQSSQIKMQIAPFATILPLNKRASKKFGIGSTLFHKFREGFIFWIQGDSWIA